MELLIGVLRFSVSESMTISEKIVDSNGAGTGTGFWNGAGTGVRGDLIDDQESKETARRQDSQVHLHGISGSGSGPGSASGSVSGVGTCASPSTGCLSALANRHNSGSGSGTQGSGVRRGSISSALPGRRSDVTPNYK